MPLAPLDPSPLPSPPSLLAGWAAVGGCSVAFLPVVACLTESLESRGHERLSFFFKRHTKQLEIVTARDSGFRIQPILNRTVYLADLQLKANMRVRVRLDYTYTWTHELVTG